MNEALFRIGGHYRQKNGVVVRLDRANFPGLTNGEAYAVRMDKERCGGYGARLLSTGICEPMTGETDDYDLIPGELTQRDGQWVPVEEAKEAPSLGKLLREAMTRHLREAMARQQANPQPAPEPKRAPLDWNKPTPFDRFPGYVVSCNTTETERFPHPAAISPDLTEARHQVCPDHALAAKRSA